MTGFVMPPHPLTNFGTQKYYQNEPKFNGVYSRDNLPKIKDGAYVINLDESKSTGIHRIALYLIGDTVIHFNSFGVKYIPKETKKFISNKNITTTVFRIQACDSIMCTYFCIGFIDFMLKEKILLEYTNLFSPNEYEMSNKVILIFFQ